MYLLSYSHKHGQDVSAFVAEFDAMRAGGLLAQQYAGEEIDHPVAVKRILDSVDVGDYRAAIEIYNENVDHETIEVLAVAVDLKGYDLVPAPALRNLRRAIKAKSRAIKKHYHVDGEVPEELLRDYDEYVADQNEVIVDLAEALI